MKKQAKRTIDSKIRKVGNSNVITIPKEIIERFKLEEGDFINLILDPSEIKRKKEK